MSNIYIMYLRKSRADNAAESVAETLARHELQLQEYAKREFGYPIPEDYIYREVVSGETIKDRPLMTLLLKQLETKRFKGVLVIEPQRLSRGDMLDCGTIVHAFRYTETLVITPMKIYNLEDKYDRKFFEMELSRGNDYLEYTKEILQRGRIASVKEGQYIGTNTPYGYTKTTYKDISGHMIHTLQPHPQEADTVRYMYELYNNGFGFSRICNILNEMGMKPRFNEHWNPTSVKHIINNPLYIGKIRWNTFKTVTSYENGELKKHSVKTDKDEYIEVEGKHPALISEDIFFQAQSRMGKNPRVKKSCEITNPLAGLVYCQCGHVMVLRPYNGSTSRPRLKCSTQTICHTHSAIFDDVVNEVINSLEKNIKSFEMKSKEAKTNTSAVRQTLLDSIQDQLSELDTQEEKQFDLLERGIYSDEIFTFRRNQLLKKREELLGRLTELNQSPITEINYEERLAIFREALKTLQNDSESAARKNLLLKQCFTRINYHSEKAENIRKVNVAFSLDFELAF